MERNQSWLARQVGKSESAISLYLSGDRTPDLDTVRAVARALRVPMRTLCQSPYTPSKRSNKRTATNSGVRVRAA